MPWRGLRSSQRQTPVGACLVPGQRLAAARGHTVRADNVGGVRLHRDPGKATPVAGLGSGLRRLARRLPGDRHDRRAQRCRRRGAAAAVAAFLGVLAWVGGGVHAFAISGDAARRIEARTDTALDASPLGGASRAVAPAREDRSGVAVVLPALSPPPEKTAVGSRWCFPRCRPRQRNPALAGPNARWRTTRAPAPPVLQGRTRKPARPSRRGLTLTPLVRQLLPGLPLTPPVPLCPRGGWCPGGRRFDRGPGVIAAHDHPIEIHGVSAAIAAVSPWIYSILADFTMIFRAVNPAAAQPHGRNREYPI
jgi:hypothetical protein